ncbi:oligosaccharide flippase family protein [Zeaxanthinibacter enoshimensis]|uniref:O-antigen/teichoic acid export membrane protein n=1 Tax=Zeaxanthinibacter enoshimensis TaxID=392009 RepID=A0A4R6TNM3_9FLAO|nr:polysaccharide biosynthesis C-terminal domain-containing protein [Zeaxanthinibacter enoshimensis]TDQ31528.1 O-antigen/teichoic acid export membrane protein [Zeaxanthinibacter enoshimensis]
MGIVFKQSLSNTITTYLGFGIGAINTLFLYTRFLTDEYYGLVGVILSTSAILMPLLAFGVPNTLVKYYSGFKQGEELQGFLGMMLLLPLGMILPIALLSFAANEAIGAFLSRENPIVAGYVWHIFLVGMAMAYFEVFYAWARVHMRTVTGNFMKEVFVRAGVSILLFLVYLDYISVQLFLDLLVALYLFRTLLMTLYAYRLKRPSFSFRWPGNSKAILTYSLLIILGGSAAVILLELDRFMINQFIPIENVAYYSVAVFIATVIAVPSRAMHQVTYPLTAELLNKQDTAGLKELYHKSSVTLLVVSGLLFLLIILNLEDLYLLLPESYRGGFIVVFLVGLAKVYDALLGNNNSILFNSEYYRAVLVMGVFLALLTIVLNLWFIPLLGINGAALATFLSISVYNTAKMWYVKVKFGIHPLGGDTYKIFLVIVALGLLFFWLPLPFHPILNMMLKSILLVLLYGGLIIRFRLSPEITEGLRWLLRLGRKS